MADLDRRDHFLIALYNQLMNDINRHIVVVWQSVATLVGAIAAFSLTEKGLISIDVAVSIVLLTCVWLIRHVYDASYWYNRNLVMIANIERQFLVKDDLRNIHYYFGKHRPAGSIISHLRIQMALGIAIGGLMLALHLQATLWPILKGGAWPTLMNMSPWIIAVSGTLICLKAAKEDARKYAEFVLNSPGITVDTAGINYSVGHGNKA